MPVTLKLHGPFAALAEDGGALPVSLRGGAILCVLALAGPEGVGRERLAGLIWSDRGEEQARASLRQELSGLRRVLGEAAIAADRHRVRLAEGAVRLAPAEGAAPLMEGFPLHSEGFEDWLRDARLQDAEARVRAGIERARQALESGEPAAARAAAQAALAVEPTREPAARLLMRAEVALGNRSAALAAYDRLRKALGQALDVTPDAETEALAAQLRAAGPAAAPKPPDPTPARRAAPRDRVRDRDRRPVLVVLPFQELGAQAGDMFADGIVEELTGALSRTDAFDVIARQSAYALGPGERDPRTAAAKLGADYIVEGSQRRSGSRLRLTVQLVAGETGVAQWSERFDDEIDDIFDVQDRIAAQVTGHLAPHLRSAEIARAHRVPREERTVYEQVLSALPHFWAHRAEDNAKAIALLEGALEIQPDDPLALGYLAWATGQNCTYQWSGDPAADRARTLALARRAMQLAGEKPAVLTAVAAAFSLLNAEYGAARVCIDKALDIDPNNAWAWLRQGWLLTYESHPAEAIVAFDRAEELSPLDPFLFNIRFGRAAALRYLGRYAEAMDEILRGISGGPGVVWAQRMVAGTAEMMGDHARALEAARLYRDHYRHLTAAQAKATLPPFTHERPYVEAVSRLIDEVWDEESG